MNTVAYKGSPMYCFRAVQEHVPSAATFLNESWLIAETWSYLSVYVIRQIYIDG